MTGECVHKEQGFGLLEQLRNTAPTYTAFEHTPGIGGLLSGLDLACSAISISYKLLIQVGHHLYAFLLL